MEFKTIKAKNITSKAKHSKILKLTGTDGNAWALMGRAQNLNRDIKLYTNDELEDIMNECMSGDYNHLLRTLMYFFNVQ